MDDEHRQEIEINGVKVQETSSPTRYQLRLESNAESFPNLDRLIKDNAEARSMAEEPLVMLTYYKPAPNEEQNHKVDTYTWKPRIEGVTCNPGDQRPVNDAEEARQIATQVISERIDYYKAMDKGIAKLDQREREAYYREGRSEGRSR